MQPNSISDLLLRAQFDEQSADILIDRDGPEATIDFHCQQAIEKLLKAVLIAKGVNANF
jgi:HEPN domain-containing protein